MQKKTLTTNPPIPFQVKDIWLASFALERGAKLVEIYRDERGFTFWCFGAEDMERVMLDWGSGTATVNIRTFHNHFFYLKGMLGRPNR